MTATQLERPAQPRRGRPPSGTRRDDNSGLLFATELASFAVTTSAIAGMHLLFDDGSFFGPLVLQALLAHVVIATARRMRIRLLPAALLVAGAAALAITWTQYMDTAVAMLPSPDTLSAIDADMDAAWQAFREVKAPAPVEPGFIAATSLTLWVIVFISDWGAFRTGVSFEALLPQATLFLFAAVLGADEGRAAGAAFFVATALLFLLLHRTWRQEGTATWAALHRQRGRSSLLMSGCTLAAVAVVAGGILGPNVPGADDEAIFGWREFTKNREPRQVISPLVDIQRRLVEQSDQEFFTVRVDDPGFGGTYWRLTALDEFSGQIWKSTYQTKDADGELEDSDDEDATASRLEQTISVSALQAIWLPAAFEPVDIDPGDESASVDYDPESSTLIVGNDNDDATSDGLVYTVVSEIPTWTADQLRNASQRIPDDIEDRYLDLPDDFSQRITDEALRVVQGSDNRYEQALALQNYFRDGSFDYSLEVPDEHSESAIENFLFEAKAGYCEQFAGSFAAMARAVGIPSRVVVGFTKGRQQNDPTLWRVTGKQAHAWAEVYFDGFGWVTFEPTPTRAPDNADDWLGLPEGLQDLGEGEAPPTPAGQDQPTAPQQGTPERPNTPINEEELNTGTGEEGAAAEEDADGGPIPDEVVMALMWLGVGFLAYLFVVPAGLVTLGYVRRRMASSPEQKVGWAWQELSASAVDSGVRLAPSLTPFEAAGRLRSAYPRLAGEIDLVAGWVEQVNYAEQSPSPEEADEAMEAGSRVATTATQRLPLHVRALRYFDARRLLPRTREARRSAHGAARSR